jgi:hypothetical protein
MNKLIKLSVLVLTTLTGPAIAADLYVQPTVKKDGTYVEGHYRTGPNSTRTDNYSSKPNVNPYTGKSGTIDPYAPPKYTAPKTYKLK